MQASTPRFTPLGPVRRSLRAHPGAWAALLSVAGHALVLAALLVRGAPAVQRPAPPLPAPAAVFRVGLWAPGGASAGEASTGGRNGAAAAVAAQAPPPGDVARARVESSHAESARKPSGEATATLPGTPVVAAASSVAEASAPPSPRRGDRAGGAGPDTAAAAAATGADAESPTGLADAVSRGAPGPGAAAADLSSAASPAGNAGAGAGGTRGGHGVASGASGATTPGADVVAAVHARLAAVAERCYPPAARRFQQRGTVGVRFCVDAAGGPGDAQVTHSSGASLLDGAVAGCVLPGAAPLPEVARGQCFTVPVRFGAAR